MSALFDSLTLRDVTFENRVWAAPMCQYSAVDGEPQDWHLVHLGGLAAGGASLVITEATSITPQGRISPADTGIWTDEQIPPWQRITQFIRSQQAVPGIQLAHAGRKASTAPPWDGGGYVDDVHGGWTDVSAPSPLAFAELPVPTALSSADIAAVVTAFAQAAVRALAAGFEVVELHAAHGYLLHSFLSPLSNSRTDGYGGGFDNRVRMLLETTEAVRHVWPEGLPLFVRVSATDWAEGGWDGDQTVELARRLKPLGVDLLDCSSGGAVPGVRIPTQPGYQVPFAARVRREAGLASSAVGLITDPHQAEQIVANGEADAVMMARALLRDPHWPQRAAHVLGTTVRWPNQYQRAAWPST